MNTSEPLKITYIDGPTVIIEISGIIIMTDPTLDPAGAKIVTNYMEERKLTGPSLMPPQHVDLVLLSHDQHFDNLDVKGREFLKEVDATITTVDGAQRLKGNAIGLAEGASKEFAAPNGDLITITATPARHGPAGVQKITGHVIGFHLAISGSNSFEIYITGDTVYYNEIEQLAKKINPKYILVNAGAARPRGPFNVTMSTNDVLDTAYVFPGAILIPLHSEGWTHYSEHNKDLVEAFKIFEIENRLRILEPGVATVLPL